jgi:uncharacterized protein
MPSWYFPDNRIVFSLKIWLYDAKADRWLSIPQTTYTEETQMGSKVFYMDARSESIETGLVPKMLTVFEDAGFDQMIKPGDVVAIKLHCGEWNNTAYLRPVYARSIADRVKALGGRPFVCDTTTLPYFTYASRVTELDMRITAERNGYTSSALGCPFIVADGYLGTGDLTVEIPEGFILKEAYIAQAIAHADVVIALTHFKGHPLGVIGGAIKNLGIGAQSKRGKFNVHMGAHPTYGFGAAVDFKPENCKGKNGCPQWELCQNCCPYGLYTVTEDSIEWRREECTGCYAHVAVNIGCGVMDMPKKNHEATCAAIADGCLATVKAVGKEKVGFINMAIDVSPKCDCVHHADVPLVPHLGVFASTDPVAIDQACLDKVIASEGVPGSGAEDFDVLKPGDRKFATASATLSDMSEEIQLNTGELIGLGSKAYNLVTCKPKAPVNFYYPPDPRQVGIRFAGNFAIENPFPKDKFNGNGFNRVKEVDFSKVR